VTGPDVEHVEAAGRWLPIARENLRDPGLARLREAILAVDDQRQQLAEQGDLDNLARGLVQLKTLLGDLRQLSQAVEDDVARLMPAKRVEVEGVGAIEKRKGTDRKSWQWDDLLPVLVRLYLDPELTGELPSSSEAVERMRALITEVIGVTPSKGPRLTPLRAAGIDPDEYAETSPGRTTVQIHDDLRAS
jgi:hypothetical protein